MTNFDHLKAEIQLGTAELEEAESMSTQLDAQIEDIPAVVDEVRTMAEAFVARLEGVGGTSTLAEHSQATRQHYRDGSRQIANTFSGTRSSQLQELNYAAWELAQADNTRRLKTHAETLHYEADQAVQHARRLIEMLGSLAGSYSRFTDENERLRQQSAQVRDAAAAAIEIL